ncbi:MAG: glycosyltransferase [Candidatus Kapaibacterium sp.]
MDRKKIIYVWKSPYPWDVRVEKICNSLAKDYEVLILARWGKEAKKAEQIDGITVRRVGFREKSIKSIPLSFNPIWKKELETVIKGFKPDAIIVREIMLGTLVGKLGKKYSIPTIMDMAENYPAVIKLFKKYKQNIFSRFLIHTLDLAKVVEKKSLNLIKNVIVVCDEQVDRLKSEKYISNHKFCVVENTPIFEENTKIDKKFTKPIFGHHGNLTGDKSVFEFLQAVIELLNEGYDMEFHIMGNGEIYQETKKIVDESGHSDKIIMYGNWKDELYQKYLKTINFGVLPYGVNDFTNTTNFNKYYDFLKFGIPIITSDTKPMSRLNNELGCGITINIDSNIDIKESIKKLYDCDYDNLSTNAYNAYVKRYNWSVDEKALLQFVKEVI